MPLVKDETSKIKQKHGLAEFCSFLFPNSQENACSEPLL